jgi:integrase
MLLISCPWCKGTKTHQRRRIGLDPDTVDVLRDHLARQDAAAAQLGIAIAPTGYLFSADPDCSTPWVPGSVSQRYDRLVARLGIDTSIHKLRHYNATELIAAGVDLRTVAGRLGHGGGGNTTLREYAAWVREADQRAATVIAASLRSATGASAALSTGLAERTSPGRVSALIPHMLWCECLIHSRSGHARTSVGFVGGRR